MDQAVATRILLVEDEPEAARALERLFARSGFATILALSLAQARHVLSRWHEEPCSYVFVDNKLGDGEGVELLAELRKLDPLPAVALVSNWMTSELAARAFRGGAVPMAKPDDEETFRDLIALLDTRRERATTIERQPGSSPLDASTQAVVFGPFTLEERDLVTPTGRHRLRRAERAILAFLVECDGRPASPQQIASEALKRHDFGAVRSVYSHVTNLRAALGAYASLIETVPGAAGYRLAVEIFER